MKIIINWLLFLLIVGGVVAVVWHRHWITGHLPAVPNMSGFQVIVFSLAIAFTWVDVFKWGSVKPFNCTPCLTGWFALLFAFGHHTQFWPLYLPLGMFIGAMFEGIKMRWL